ncbi:MAG: hypothetical protein BWX61_01007 [Bacteroidetes bacterium ADurb.Bin035]|jgi:hypothetical protein|nr:MAG: hypothetical protein BWX61_01007 [Bacteroidetes bacterium ADurb.Bin035]
MGFISEILWNTDIQMIIQIDKVVELRSLGV